MQNTSSAQDDNDVNGGTEFNSSSDEYYDSEAETYDPLLEDKQYIVAHIVN